MVFPGLEAVLRQRVLSTINTGKRCATINDIVEMVCSTFEEMRYDLPEYKHLCGMVSPGSVKGSRLIANSKTPIKHLHDARAMICHISVNKAVHHFTPMGYPKQFEAKQCAQALGMGRQSCLRARKRHSGLVGTCKSYGAVHAEVIKKFNKKYCSINDTLK